MPDGEEAAEERIWRAMPAGARQALTRDLPTDRSANAADRRGPGPG